MTQIQATQAKKDRAEGHAYMMTNEEFALRLIVAMGTLIALTGGLTALFA